MHPDPADAMPVPAFSSLRALPPVCLLAWGLAMGSTAHASTGSDETASDWSVAIGPSVYVTPKYPGARTSFVFPWVDQEIEYKHRFFSKGTDFLGAYLANDDTWQVGGNFQLDPTWRHASDDARLAGLGNVNATVRAKAFAQYTVSFLTLSTDAEQDILGNRQGLIVNGDAYVSAPVGRWLFSLGAGLSWVNGQYMHTFFGVDEVQSARSGLRSSPRAPACATATSTPSSPASWTTTGPPTAPSPSPACTAMPPTARSRSAASRPRRWRP